MSSSSTDGAACEDEESVETSSLSLSGLDSRTEESLSRRLSNEVDSSLESTSDKGDEPSGNGSVVVDMEGLMAGFMLDAETRSGLRERRVAAWWWSGVRSNERESKMLTNKM